MWQGFGTQGRGCEDDFCKKVIEASPCPSQPIPAVSKRDPLLLKTKPFSHSDSASGITYLSRVENSCITSEGLWQAGEVGREELSEIEQRQMQGPVPSKEYPHAPGEIGGHPDGKQLCSERCGCHEPEVWPRRPVISWGAFGRTLSAGWGRLSCPSTQPWWGHVWSIVCSSGLLKQERHGFPRVGLEEGEKDN